MIQSPVPLEESQEMLRLGSIGAFLARFSSYSEWRLSTAERRRLTIELRHQVENFKDCIKELETMWRLDDQPPQIGAATSAGGVSYVVTAQPFDDDASEPAAFELESETVMYEGTVVSGRSYTFEHASLDHVRAEAARMLKRRRIEGEEPIFELRRRVLRVERAQHVDQTGNDREVKDED